MRFNKQELETLATQPSSKFEKEGTLYIRERQEGFFRKSERNDNKKQKKRLRNLSCVGGISKANLERWCRLRGNLLFYFKSKDSWSEPIGVVVLEQCQVKLEPPMPVAQIPLEGYYPFYLVFDGGLCQSLAASSDTDRCSWMEAIRSASYEGIRAELHALRQCLERRRTHRPHIDLHMWRLQKSHTIDLSELPLCEISLACDNLLCDGHGRPPNPSIVIDVFMPQSKIWVNYGNTEIIDRSSNPSFFTTTTFRASDGLTGDSRIRFTVFDVRERVSHTAIPLGAAQVLLASIQDGSRLRVPVLSARGSSVGNRDGPTPSSTATSSSSSHSVKSVSFSSCAVNNSPSNLSASTVGFLTISAWCLEEAEAGGNSTEHTPYRVPQQPKLGGLFVNGQNGLMAGGSSANGSGTSVLGQLGDTINSAGSNGTMVHSHRRSQSLPPRLGVKMRLPNQAELKLLYASPFVQTYRFHSGLGGDICVHELMAESKLCFTFPHQLLGVWIHQEKELLQEVAGMGELREPWHSRQVELLDRHLQLLRLYSQAREQLQAHKGRLFKPSSRKNDRSLEFAPVNLHLQRMWVHNDTLNKAGFYDVVTVGAFTAHSHRSMNGGLIKLVQQLKESPLKSSLSSNQISTKISMSYDAIQAIKLLRKDVVEAMRALMRLAKEKQTLGMLPICEDMISKTKILLGLWDPGLVEEALSFMEEYKMAVMQDGEAEDLLNSDQMSSLQVLSPFKRITQQLTLDLKSPELEDFATPCGSKTMEDLWQLPSSVDKSHRNMGNSCCKKESTIADEDGNMLNSSYPIEGQENFEEDDTQRNYVIYPKDGDRLAETFELKHSNGNCTASAHNSSATLTPPSHHHNNQQQQRPQQFLDTHVMCVSPSANYYKPTDEPEPWDLTQLNIEASVMCLVSKVKFLCGRCGSPAVRLRSAGGGSKGKIGKAVGDSTGSKMNTMAVNNSVKVVKNINKFTEGLDLTKIADWAAELRPSMRKLRQAMDGLLKTARLTHSVFRVQEDPRAAQKVCNVRYRRDVCFSQALTSLVTALMTRLWCQKPDVSFITSLISLGPIACFEGLLSYYGNEIDMFGDMSVAIEDLRTVTFMISRSPSPMSADTQLIPKITGNRNSMHITLPVPDSFYTLLPSRKNISFHVTPVFFNIGINERATIAESVFATKPQERSNIDNYDRLNEYYLRYRKLAIVDDGYYYNGRASSSAAQQRPLAELIDELKRAVHNGKGKNVTVLSLSGQICRQMKGLRFTSCKSAKDRTGMSVTLEQCQILMDEYHLAENEFQRALDTIRSEGCRRENTLKNINVRKYAFNALQLLALPKQYRPPAGTFGSAQT